MSSAFHEAKLRCLASCLRSISSLIDLIYGKRAGAGTSARTNLWYTAFTTGRLPWSSHALKFEESFARSGQRWTKESLILNNDIQRQKETMFASGGVELDLREYA